MKNIIAFAGSNSKNSINKQLAIYATSLLNDVEVTVLDLNNYELPIYGIDHENEVGIPENAQKFLNLIQSSNGIVLSLAEHNGSYASVFKNIFDWMSRIDKNVWANKPMLLMSTSPGGRGGATVLESAKSTFPHLGGNIVADFSVPSFYDNFKEGKISNQELDLELKKVASNFSKSLA
ncbi:MAG: NAD(P)H-dependent oxidoreductase [Flavobacteriaceae bacterium]|nr:NAD(P)H-dependent oxidoreductase [Flavobacteriaceae bacterium]